MNDLKDEIKKRDGSPLDVQVQLHGMYYFHESLTSNFKNCNRHILKWCSARAIYKRSTLEVIYSLYSNTAYALRGFILYLVNVREAQL